MIERIRTLQWSADQAIAARSRPMSRTALRVLLTLTVVASSFALVADPAVACSCIEPEANSLLANSEAAFIGTYLEMAGDISGDSDGSGGNNVGYTFEVERWLAGPFTSPEIVIASPEDGSSCGFEIQPGGYVAVFLYGTEDGVPNSGLCNHIDGDLAKQTLQPMAVDPDAGPAQFLVASPGGPAALLLVDKTGRTAGFSEGMGGTATLNAVSPCAGGELAVESWIGEESAIVVRDLATLEALSTEPIDGQPWESVSCLSADGTDIRGTYRLGEDVVVTGIPADDPLTLPRLFGVTIDTTSRRAFGFGENGVISVDLDSGEVAGLFQNNANPNSEFRSSVEGVSVSPDGSAIAFAIVEFGRAEEGPTATLYVVDIETGATVERTFEMEGSAPVWLSDSELMLNGYSAVAASSVLLDRSLETIGEGPAEAAAWFSPVAEGEIVHFFEGSELIAANVATGATEALAILPISQFGSTLYRLGEPVTVTATLPVAGGELQELGTLPVAADADADADKREESERQETDDSETAAPQEALSSGGGTWSWLLPTLAGVALVGAIAWFIANRRRIGA